MQRTVSANMVSVFPAAGAALLAVGGWVWTQRAGGDTWQMVTGLAVAEAFALAVLVVATVQWRGKLLLDGTRSAAVVLGLSAWQLLLVGQWSAPSAEASAVLGVAVLASALVKLAAGPRIIGFALPEPAQLACVLWLGVLAAPSVAARWLPNPADYSSAAAGICWLTAGAVALHLPLVAWQRRTGPIPDGGLLEWWHAWLAVGGLAGAALVGLHAWLWPTMGGENAWVFAPVYLSAGAVAVALATALRSRLLEAWTLLAAATVFSLWVIGDVPVRLDSWLSWPGTNAALWLSAMLIAGGMAARSKRLMISAAIPVLVGLVLMVRHVWEGPGGATTLAGGAGVLLVAGVGWQVVVTRGKQIIPPQASRVATGAKGERVELPNIPLEELNPVLDFEGDMPAPLSVRMDRQEQAFIAGEPPAGEVGDGPFEDEMFDEDYDDQMEYGDVESLDEEFDLDADEELDDEEESQWDQEEADELDEHAPAGTLARDQQELDALGEVALPVAQPQPTSDVETDVDDEFDDELEEEDVADEFEDDELDEEDEGEELADQDVDESAEEDDAELVPAGQAPPPQRRASDRRRGRVRTSEYIGL